MSSLLYFLKESLTGFSRNLSTALGSIVTIFLSLLIIGIFLIGGFIVENVVSSVEDKVSISVWLSDDASDSDITTLESYIQGLEGVESVGFTTKEQALENFRNSMTSNPEIVDQLDGQNPLPASIEVELSDPQMVETIAGQIQSNATFTKICDNPGDPADSLKYGQKSVERLFDLTNYIRYIGIALIALLIFIAMVFINNTIRLAILARRKEIAIMRLVGASNGFIPHGGRAARHYRIASGGRIARASAFHSVSADLDGSRVASARSRLVDDLHDLCASDRGGSDHRPPRLGACYAPLPEGVAALARRHGHGQTRRNKQA